MKLAIEKNARILAIFAIVCTAIVGITFEFTKNRIKKQEQAQLLSTLKSIVPATIHNNDMSEHCVGITDEQLGSNTPQIAYLATLNGQAAGAAITSVAPDGYNGNIFIISAFTVDGTITGVRVLKHKETPGLGDKVELRKSDWVKSFDSKTFDDMNESRWAVKKDGGQFDQFTGATITPRAVVKAVRQAALFFNKNMSSLFEQPNMCETNQ